ncbi:MAG TPA: glucan 1,4-alpha-glucosidase [Chitinophagaceae bacterium]|nr:glucan 1,4-alpha-glucosidase [Chitinophagaceae bacterium]
MSNNRQGTAPGWPGIPARWTSSAKDGIGKALNASSNVSFTISHGILNEIYFPREDTACTRDMEFIVADGKAFFSEEKRHTFHDTHMVEKGIPAYQVTNRCLDGNYQIEKQIIADPIRDVVLQKVRFKALKGEKKNYQLYAIMAPHINNCGGGNTAWVGEYKGVPMIFAHREGKAIAFACSSPWKKCSVGFVGASDGWQDIHQNKQMTREYQLAEDGNIALTSQIDLDEVGDSFLLAIGFGSDQEEAGLHAWSSLLNGFDRAYQQYIKEWQDWQKTITHQDSKKSPGNMYRESAAVLRIHEAQRFPGAIVASMSIPWGDAKGDKDIGGYHMVWSRDLVESSGGLMAMGAQLDMQRILNYLAATQEADGSWPQNMWLSGKAHWNGIQLDEMALPILLIDLFKNQNLMEKGYFKRFSKMIVKASGYLIREGPFTFLDRWEELAGYSTFTLAAEIAALLSAADFAQNNDMPKLAVYLYETADCWNDNVEKWTYVTGTKLAKEVGVEGYYIRINPDKNSPAQALNNKKIDLGNHENEEGWVLANEVVSPDALALVRFGLRDANDPRILNTIKVIDHLLKVETPHGPCWYRYNNDGYGEKSDGSAYNGKGAGRLWPLLTGERAHYEIAAGHLQKAKSLIKTLESFSHYGLLPEQIWDQKDIPEKELVFGKPSGSAMPLVWAQSEYIKLCASLKLKKIFDMPEHGRLRYLENDNKCKHEIWRFEQPIDAVTKDKKLRIETKAHALIHWTMDNWKTVKDVKTKDSGLGIYFADLPKANKKGAFCFTFHWEEANQWENKNFKVDII